MRRAVIAVLVLGAASAFYLWWRDEEARKQAIAEDLREPDFVTKDGRVVPSQKRKIYPEGQPAFTTEAGDPIPESELGDRLAKGEAFGVHGELYLMRDPTDKIIRVDGSEVPKALAAGCTLLSPREGRLFQEHE
jgi:hypothetical protein